MKSKVRRWAERYYREPLKRQPVFLGVGMVSIFPSRSDPLTRMHVVAQTKRVTPGGKTLVEYVCSCEAFYHNAEDLCPHVIGLRNQIMEGEAKLLKKMKKGKKK